VTGDGVVTFRIEPGSSTGADYSSRDGTASRAPQLVVELAP
jgi:hypothetical protein